MDMVHWLETGRATVRPLKRYRKQPPLHYKRMVTVLCDGERIAVAHQWRIKPRDHWSRPDPHTIWVSGRTYNLNQDLAPDHDLSWLGLDWDEIPGLHQSQ